MAADRTRASYDAVAERYAADFASELDHKPLERGLLDAFVALAGGGVVADVGCGPAHVARYLADRGARTVAIDLSPRMVEAARRVHPGLDVRVGSMTSLDVPDGAWAGAVALYSIIHLATAERAAAFAELARALRPGGWLLVSFHVSAAEHPPGTALHLARFLDADVDLTAYFLEPETVLADARAAGLALRARLDREPYPDVEYPSRRSYLLLQR